MSKRISETLDFKEKEDFEKLSGYYFFSNFSQDEISLLLLCAEQISCEKDEVIFRENDTGLSFYFILSGEVLIRKENSGRELAVLKPGEIFGDMSVLDNHPRSASAIAVTEVELFVFDGPRLLNNFPHLSVKLLRFLACELSKRLRAADNYIDHT